MKDVDSLLYVDTDVVFLTSPEKVWEHFTKMNSEQMVAAAREHENITTSWYRINGDYPYYGTTGNILQILIVCFFNIRKICLNYIYLGLNSGVLLMNLTRMRTFGFEQFVFPIFQKYKALMHMGDQDTFNIFFHDHAEKLYEYPCQYNFRPDHWLMSR